MSASDQNPGYYKTVMPYLILKDVSKFLAFTQNVFGAEVKMKHTDDDGRIVHAEIVIGDSTLMAGESNKDWTSQPAGLYINVDSADETYQKALHAGAETVMELSNKEYGRSAGVKDSNGNTWWITSKR
ncbi:MAG TPA: VOC family protein [Gracilimonas sp.]|uniref:VOC family protein n=1 Tax=Gracilimonas sp. TaxID=1974203 RepID=UPI002D9D5261|nr:VOC family protein [Gracilimonas sp.]